MRCYEQAGRGSREATLRQQSRKLRADIARLQGLPIPALPLEDRLQRSILVEHSLSGHPFSSEVDFSLCV